MTSSMNRPGTKINWVTNVDSSNQIEDTIIRPTFLQLFSSDKGPEGLRTVHGNEFFKLYGNNPSFKKHGQPLFQAAEIIKAGGELLCKRIVAEDSTLANLVVVAKVIGEQVQKKNANGELLFIDPSTGKETTESNGGTYERAMMNTAKIKYDTVSIKDIKTINQAKVFAKNLVKDEVLEENGYENTAKVGDPLTETTPVGQVKDTEDPDYNKYIYPLFVISDNGRGLSSKRFKIVPEYSVSKNLNFQIYKLQFIGDTADDSEYVWFSFRDDIVYLGENRSLDIISGNMLQIKAAAIEDSIELFVNRIHELTGIEVDELNSLDILFGKTRKGEKLSQITIDTTEGYNLNSDLGMMLAEGSNGSFGDAPFEAATYADEMVKVLDGTFDDSIYDVDRFMIDVCADANYPLEVKKAIYELAKFREDFVYLRDFGTDNATYESIRSYFEPLPKSKFVGNYVQAWDIIDPWTKKQITVTETCSIAPKLVAHLNDRRSAPICGILYGFTFPEVIEGTVTFLPKVTPNVDQKALCNDINANYASYINGVLTLETCYTSHEGNKNQMSFINNILAVTKVIHNIRQECPKIRYSFITDTDLEKYREEVNKVILRNSTDFDQIYMEYTQDEVMAANKIFEADIFVKFKNFEQEEIFNIYTLNN